MPPSFLGRRLLGMDTSSQPLVAAFPQKGERRSAKNAPCGSWVSGGKFEEGAGADQPAVVWPTAAGRDHSLTRPSPSVARTR